jgi:hypothetical protein
LNLSSEFLVSKFGFQIQLVPLQRGEVIFSSSGVLPDDVIVEGGPDLYNRQHCFENCVEGPEAISDNIHTGNQDRIHFLGQGCQLDLVLARSDGALHTLGRGIELHDSMQGDAQGNRERMANFLVLEGPSLTPPWVPIDDDHDNVEPMCLLFDVTLQAAPHDGSPWKKCHLHLYVEPENNTNNDLPWDECCFETADDAAHALAALPWTSW